MAVITKTCITKFCKILDPNLLHVHRWCYKCQRETAMIFRQDITVCTRCYPEQNTPPQTDNEIEIRIAVRSTYDPAIRPIYFAYQLKGWTASSGTIVAIGYDFWELIHNVAQNYITEPF